MKEAGVSEGFPAGDSAQSGEPLMGKEERSESGLGNDSASPFLICDSGVSDGARIRRSERRKSSRAFAARGRLARARPKSPLLRMAEMRKGSLRGRDMRISGVKGSAGSSSKASKGKKGSAERGLKFLTSIPEICEVEIGDSKDLGEKGDVSEVEGVPDNAVAIRAEQVEIGVSRDGDSLMSVEEVRGRCEGVEKELELLVNESPVALAGLDIVLDLCEAQPLQNMSFLVPKGSSERGGGLEDVEAEVRGRNWANLKEVNLHDTMMGERFSNADFPPLNKGSLQSTKNKEVPPLPEHGGGVIYSRRALGRAAPLVLCSVVMALLSCNRKVRLEYIELGKWQI